MTCIIGHRDGWMVADVAHTFNDHTTCPCYQSKVWRAGVRPAEGERIPWQLTMLWATCGASVLKDLVLDHLSEHQDKSPVVEISKVFRQNPDKGEALIVTAGGDIFHIASSGAILNITGDYWAIGSGYQAALGYLRGVRHQGDKGKPVTIEDAQQAIAMAAMLNHDVSPSSTFDQLEKG